jgi:uncharacterized membrane protein YphA (DoxX/SURF4 family)
MFNQALSASASAAPPAKWLNITLWAAQVALAAMFVMAGASKLFGAPEMVRMFETIGMGQWFRVLTGGIELAAAVALLVPRTAPFGAMLLMGTMAGAALTHWFVVGDSAAVPLALFAVAAVVAWGRRDRVLSLLHR